MDAARRGKLRGGVAGSRAAPTRWLAPRFLLRPEEENEQRTRKMSKEKKWIGVGALRGLGDALRPDTRARGGTNELRGKRGRGRWRERRRSGKKTLERAGPPVSERGRVARAELVWCGRVLTRVRSG